MDCIPANSVVDEGKFSSVVGWRLWLRSTVFSMCSDPEFYLQSCQKKPGSSEKQFDFATC